MGTYTTLGVHAIVKSEFRSVVAAWWDREGVDYAKLHALLLRELDQGVLFFDGSGSAVGSDMLRDLREYQKDHRHRWVPNYFPDDGAWAKKREYDSGSGRLCFTCALKNYDKTIEAWFRLVGRHLIERYELVQRTTGGDDALYDCLVSPDGELTWGTPSYVPPDNCFRNMSE